MSAELRREWVCSECSVRVYKPCHDLMPAPTGWDREADQCLSCIKRSDTPGVRVRRMLLEGQSVTKATNGSKGLNKKQVTEIREKLIESGELDPTKKPKGGPKPKPQPSAKKLKRRRKNQLADALLPLLEADPKRDSDKLADELNASVTRVRVLRKNLGYPHPNQKP